MCCRRIVLCSSLQLEFNFLISSVPVSGVGGYRGQTALASGGDGGLAYSASPFAASYLSHWCYSLWNYSRR